MAQEPEENPHVLRQRSIKIGKIVPALRRREIHWRVVESYTTSQWEQLAESVGVKVPSETTRRQIVRILMPDLQLDRVAS